MEKRVFISYRRDDTAPVARLIYDRLCPVLSKDHVFLDVSTIHGGDDFQRKITTEIGRCDVALVLIGDRWLGSKEQAQFRICQSDDYVRLEIREALASSKIIIPVLVSSTKMPKPDQLPDDIRTITSRNALLLRHESFDDDVESIISAIVGETDRARAWEAHTSIWLRAVHSLGGMLAAILLLVGLALTHFLLFQQALSDSIGAPLTTLLFLAAIVLGGWVGLRNAGRLALRARTSRRLRNS
jgi:TIR domain